MFNRSLMETMMIDHDFNGRHISRFLDVLFGAALLLPALMPAMPAMAITYCVCTSDMPGCLWYPGKQMAPDERRLLDACLQRMRVPARREKHS